MSPVTNKEGEAMRRLTIVMIIGSANQLAINVLGNFDARVHHNCKNPWYARTQWPLSDPRTKAMMSLAISSLISRLSVYVTTDGCDANRYSILTGIQLQQK